jgi:hypothetical protein
MFARSPALLLFNCPITQRTFIRAYTTSKPVKMTPKHPTTAMAKAHDFLDFVNASPTRTSPFSRRHQSANKLQHITPSTLPSNDSPPPASKRSKNATAGPPPSSLAENITSHETALLSLRLASARNGNLEIPLR